MQKGRISFDLKIKLINRKCLRFQEKYKAFDDIIDNVIIGMLLIVSHQSNNYEKMVASLG